MHQTDLKAKALLKDGVVKIWKKKYSVVKARYVPDFYVAAIQDPTEITVVMDEASVDQDMVLLEEKGWKIITFDMALPFELVGFLSIVSNALSDVGVSIYALSSFSTDHIMVKETDLGETVHALQDLGCVVEYLA